MAYHHRRADPIRRLTPAIAALLLLFGCAGGAGTPPGAPAAPATATLRFVLLVSRHGVRAPLGSNAAIARFAAQPWPDWGVPAGNLTAHGGDAAQVMGAYYGSFYRRMGLISADCPVPKAYLYADSDQRTIVTGERIAQGMNNSCAPVVNHPPARAA